MTGASRPDHAMQIVEPRRAPRTAGPHNGRVTACKKERREALWMPVFVDAPTAGWDVQANPCGTALAAVLCLVRMGGIEPKRRRAPAFRLKTGCSP